MTPEERFIRGANAAKFKVRGISGYLQKTREYSKLMQLVQIISANPLLLQIYQRDYSMEKTFSQVLSAGGIREDQVKLTEEEAATAQYREKLGQSLAQSYSQATGQQGGQATENVKNFPNAQGVPTVKTPTPAEENAPQPNTEQGM